MNGPLKDIATSHKWIISCEVSCINGSVRKLLKETPCIHVLYCKSKSMAKVSKQAKPDDTKYTKMHPTDDYLGGGGLLNLNFVFVLK